MVTFDVDKMDITDNKVLGRPGQSYGRIFARPCFPSIPTSPYVTDDDKETPHWNISNMILTLVDNQIRLL